MALVAIVALIAVLVCRRREPTRGVLRSAPDGSATTADPVNLEYGHEGSVGPSEKGVAAAAAWRASRQARQRSEQEAAAAGGGGQAGGAEARRSKLVVKTVFSQQAAGGGGELAQGRVAPPSIRGDSRGGLARAGSAGGTGRGRAASKVASQNKASASSSAATGADSYFEESNPLHAAAVAAQEIQM